MGASRSVTLRDGHRLTMFVNRVRRAIFDPKSEEATVVGRKSHNEMIDEFVNLTKYLIFIGQITDNDIGGICDMYDERSTYRCLMGNSEGREIF